MRVPSIIEKLHLDLNPDAIAKKSSQVRELLGTTSVVQTRQPQAQSVLGAKKGVTIVVEFSDQAKTAPVTTVDSMLNGDGYLPSGSAKEYFFDVSGGKLTYTNEIIGYIKASKPFTYYDDPTPQFGTRAKELVKEMLDSLVKRNFDFSKITINSSNTLVAVSLFYAGSAKNGWSKGMWPHKWEGLNWTSPTGLKANQYQVSGLTGSPNIGTFCHENGHMLLGLPDLYPYTGGVNWVGSLCLMSSGGGANPSPLNPYFRKTLGWLTTEDITTMKNGRVTMKSNDMAKAVQYNHHSDPKQYFLIENIEKKGRWSTNAPGSGTVVWRVNTNSGTTNTTSESANPTVAVVGLPSTSVASAAILANRPNIAFSSATTPAAKWYNSVNANIEMRNLSAAGAQMTFDIGAVGILDNPTTSISPFSISGNVLNLNLAGSANVTLISYQGRAVLDMNVQGNSVIDLGAKNLSAGIYLLQIRSAQGTIVHKFSTIR